jgi:hypothetical protein
LLKEGLLLLMLLLLLLGLDLECGQGSSHLFLLLFQLRDGKVAQSAQAC